MVRVLASGAVGAAVLTLVHEVARRFIPQAPQVHILGMRALAQAFRAREEAPPARDTLFDLSLLGDLVSNAIYYSLAATGTAQQRWRRGALLGLLAGLGTLFLPGPLGLGREPTGRSRATQVMTVAWYLTGGLAAAAASRLFAASPST